MADLFYAVIAQLVEHLTCNQGVVGSSPTGSLGSRHCWVVAGLQNQEARFDSVAGFLLTF